MTVAGWQKETVTSHSGQWWEPKVKNSVVPEITEIITISSRIIYASSNFQFRGKYEVLGDISKIAHCASVALTT